MLHTVLEDLFLCQPFRLLMLYYETITNWIETYSKDSKHFIYEERVFPLPIK